MPLEVLPLIASDIPAIIDIYFAAFQNPLALKAFPATPPVRAPFDEFKTHCMGRLA